MAERRREARPPRDGQRKDNPPRRPAASPDATEPTPTAETGRPARADRPAEPEHTARSGPGADDDHGPGFTPGHDRRGAVDDVDHVVAAWQRERPDLDVTPLHVLSRITRLAHHLDRERRRAFSRHELELFEFDVLSALRREGEPYQLTPGQLLASTLVTSGTMTNRIDRLVNRGLVTREPDPLDRRGVIVQLTDLGRAMVDAALADLVVTERRLLGVLSDGQADTLGALLRRLCLRYDSLPVPDDAQ